MNKSYLNEPGKFTRNKKLSVESQFQKNLDDFHSWVKTDVSSYELGCLTAEKAINKIQDTLERYAKEQDILLEEMLRGEEE